MERATSAIEGRPCGETGKLGACGFGYMDWLLRGAARSPIPAAVTKNEKPRHLKRCGALGRLVPFQVSVACPHLVGECR